MDILSSFLYKIISDYVDINKIIELCEKRGFMKIDEKEIVGNFVYKEKLGYIKIILDKNTLKGYIKYDDKKEIFKSYKNDRNYISNYKEKIYLENDLIKSIDKMTVYDKNRNFLFRKEESTIFEGKMDFKNKKKYYFKDISTIIKIDDKNLIKKNKIITENNKQKEIYSISSDFKEGIFGSGNINLEEYYLGFTNIEEQQYNKLLKKIFYY